MDDGVRVVTGSQETTPWTFYGIEPLGTRNISDPFYINASAARRLLGGQASMWAMQTDAHNLESRVWPATCTIAERLWSAQNLTIDDVDKVPGLPVATEFRQIAQDRGKALIPCRVVRAK